MKLVLEQASKAPPEEVPIAALLVGALGEPLLLETNAVHVSGDLTAHAEMMILRKLGPYLELVEPSKATLVVNLEPCPMCAWAIKESGIGRVIFGAYNNSYGACGSVTDPLRDTRFGKMVEVIGGVLEVQCSQALSLFFADLRRPSE